MGECPPRPPRTALRQRAVERHVEIRSAKRLQTHRLTAVQTRSLFVSPLRGEIPSRATQLAECYAALAYRYLTAAQWLSGYEGCRNLSLPAADCALSSFLKAEAAPEESDCVAREGIFARRAKTNLPMCLRRCESSSLGRFAELLLTCLVLPAADVPCETVPFVSFSGRAEKEGPARPERVPIFLPCNQKGKHNAEILRMVLVYFTKRYSF